MEHYLPLLKMKQETKSYGFKFATLLYYIPWK